MCGIIGYVGKEKNCIKTLITGLKNLEYRGYDSAGIALARENEIKIIKKEGKIKNLEESLTGEEETNLGIGHTRWATHGIANETNSHPHQVGKLTIVHNGIIENYIKLKETLEEKGYKFKTTTDTEIACALLDSIYKEEKNKLKVLKKANELIKGSFAFGIIFEDDKENLYAMRKDSPLILALNSNENYLASDVPAILEFTNKYILLETDEYAVLNKNEIKVYDKDLNEIKKQVNIYEGKKESVMKNGYKHFMIKEINDEPEVFNEIEKEFNLENIEDLVEKINDLKKYEEINIIGCGSAYHAGLVGKYYIENIAKIKTNVEIASEYRYKTNFTNEKTLTILISQSGETADTLAALRKAKKENLDTLGIINTVSSSIAREADKTLYLKAGCEISVATTKAYSAQVLILLLFSLSLAYQKGQITKEEANKLIKEIKNLKNKIKKEIKKQEKCKEIAKIIENKDNIFYIGRQIDYALCMEASLKLKEISYIHSESYPAGELKHGTISLIEEQTPVIAIVTDKKIAEKTISNIKEVKSRGANVILITTDKLIKEYESDFYDQKIIIEEENEITTPLKVATIIQLLAYEVANIKNLSIDKPRNLAKSVTVE